MNKISLILFLSMLFIMVCISGNVFAGNGVVHELDQYLDTYSDYGIFSGTVLVAKDGNIIINKAYGKADYELDVKNSTDSIYRIGSLTKQFTAAAVLQLDEKELLDIDENISNYVSNFSNADRITIRNLLNHTSGIYDYTRSKEFRSNLGNKVELENVINIFRNKKLNFNPGDKYEYSNSNYLLLGYIIEKITDMSYEGYLKENILDPLGMKNTGFAYHDRIIKNRSTGYTLNPDGSKSNIYHDDATYAHGAGALYSTTRDLLRWDQALYTDKILTDSSLKKMFTKYKNNYGFGFKIDEVFGKNKYYHHGATMGYTASINRFIDDSVTIIVLTNLNGTPIENIVKEISAIVFNEDYYLPKKYSLDEDKFIDYEGKYKMDSNRKVIIKSNNDKYYIKLNKSPFFEIVPTGNNEFVVKVFAEMVEFNKKNDEITIHHLHGIDKGKKIE
ncbi:MAG: serine hydrolase domain-containing protein [Bacillota bacterium]